MPPALADGVDGGDCDCRQHDPGMRVESYRVVSVVCWKAVKRSGAPRDQMGFGAHPGFAPRGHRQIHMVHRSAHEDILDGQQTQRRVRRRAVSLAGIQEHRLRPDDGKKS